MVCPNINTKEWKDLEKSVGRIEAYRMFIANNYEIPGEKVDTIQVDQDKVERLTRLTEIRNSFRLRINNKIDDLKGNKTPSGKLLKTNMEVLRSNIEDASAEEAMIMYLEGVEGYLVSLDKQVKNLDVNVDNVGLLRNLYTYSGIADDLGEVADYIQDYELEGFDKERIDKIDGLRMELKRSYIRLGRSFMAKKLAKKSKIKTLQQKEILEKEFNTKWRGKLPKAEFQKKREEYISRGLSEMGPRLQRMEEDYINELLKTAPRDLDFIDTNLIDGRAINDQIIQLAVTQLDWADHKSTQDWLEARKNLLDTKELYEIDTFGDHRKMYDGVIEKIDGKETNYYVRPMYSTFYEIEGEFQKTRKNFDDFSERIAFVTEFKQKYYKKEPKKEVDWLNPAFVKDEYKNNQFNLLDGNKKHLYNKLIAFNFESDQMLSPSSRLGFKLPGVENSAMQDLVTKGPAEMVINKVKDLFTERADDVEYGVKNVKVNDQQAEKMFIPVHFRNDVKNQSYDLISLALANRFSSLNYMNKKNVQADIEVIKDLIGERKVNRNDGTRSLQSLISFGKEKESINVLMGGKESNAYKAINSIIEERLYGKRQVVAKFLNMDLNKTSDALLAASGHTMLALNITAGAINTISGKISSWLWTSTNLDKDLNDFADAEKMYASDINGIMQDVGADYAKSKTNLFMEKFMDNAAGLDPFNAKLAEDNRTSRLISTKSLQGIQHSSEHFISGTLMYALLKDVKLTNADSEYINREGKVVDKKDAVSILDVYEAKNGKLILQEGFYYNGQPINQEVEFQISRKTKDTLAKLQGNYDDNNRAMIQRYWWGKLGMYLRKWIVRSTLRRWQGVATALTPEENLQLNDKYYSQAREEFDEGTYTAGIRFINQLYLRLKQQGVSTAIASQEWNSMTDRQRARIIEGGKELIIAVGALVAGTILAGIGKGEDDEDKEFLYGAAYVSRRLFDEYALYTPYAFAGGEMFRMISTPSATMSSLESAVKIMKQMFEPTEEFKTGRRRKKNKLLHLVRKQIDPYYGQIEDKNFEDSYKYLTRGQ